MRERNHPLVRACVATSLSGVGAMLYQLAWVRKLTGVTTAASIATMLVLAAFMAGLGIGAWLGGKVARRATRPLRAYAVVEVVAGGLFLLGVPVLQLSLRLQHALLDVGMSANGALAFQLTAVALYLVASTSMLGAALPLLVAGLETLGSTERLVKTEVAYNLIYGLNTLGAVAGCVLCGYVTIEYIGLTRSIALGVACSLASAVIAISIGGAAAPPLPVADVSDPRFISRRLLAVVFATGAIALAVEVLWIRMLSLVIFNTVYAFTQVIASVLLGIAVAGFAATMIGRRLLRSADPATALLRVTFGALLLAAVCMSIVPWLTHTLAGTDGFAGLAASGRSLRVMMMLIAILLPSSALLAVVLPLVITAARSRNTAQTLSRMFAVNTLGAVVGSLVVGLWMLPGLGLGGAQPALAGAAIVVALLIPGRVFGRRGWAAAAVAGAIVFGMRFAIDLPEDLYALRFEQRERILEFREGVTSDVLVSEDTAGHRRIWINSSWVAGTGGGHASLGHLPAISVKRIDRALGIALGTGQTFAAVLDHGAKHLDCVEINPDVIELSKRWFGDFNNHLFAQPNVQVHLEDGRAFLRATRERYDLIVLEPLQAWSAGTTSLYTREFYADARRVLRDGGVLAQWIPFYGQDVAATRAMVRTALEVFPEASLWLDERDGILLMYRGTFVMPWPELRDAASHSLAFAELMAAKHIDREGDLLALFLMGPRGLASWTRDADVLVDDRPFLEYAAARQLGVQSFAPTLETTFADLEDPGDYMTSRARASYDAKPTLAARRAALARPLCVPAHYETCATEMEADLAIRSEQLHYQYRQLVLAWAESARGVRAVREQILLRGIAQSPDFGEAMINLAVSLAERRQYDAALTYATRAQAIPRTRERAELILAKLRARP